MDSRRRAIAPQSAGEAAKAAVAPALTPQERQRETAEYIADMILELRNLARGNQLYTVMVPLEYAYYEAFTAANRVEVPEAEIERIKELSKVSQELERPPEAG